MFAVTIAVSGLLLSAPFSVEIRDELLLLVSPESFRNEVFLKLETRDQRIYLLGTIHERHLTTPAYSLEQIEGVVLRLRPDLLLVESRPEELARDNWADGPIEMPVASLTARSAGIKVKGFNWWVADNTHRIDSNERERRMIQNIRGALAGEHSVLILTGFSHVEPFEQSMIASGYTEAGFSRVEKDTLFAPVGKRFLFPYGMTHYLQRRIALDQAALLRETDPFWKDRLAGAVQSRIELLEIVASTGEERP